MFSSRSRFTLVAFVLHALVAASVGLTCGAAVAGQVPVAAPTVHGVPGSYLIFPLFDSLPGRGTILSITNTNTSRVSCGNFFLGGDICVHYTYVNHDGSGNCDEFDRLECLTPADTLTVLVDIHNPQMEEGWLWVEALDPETLRPIVFNSLIGSAIIVDSTFEFGWSYTPYAFQALPTAPCPAGGAECGPVDRCFTDLDGGIDADFDGRELTRFPDTLLLDQFFEELSPNTKKIDNELALMTTERDDDTNASVVIWNNSETRFSRGFVFQCHFRGRLSEIAAVVKDLGGTDEERFQTGWIEFQAVPGMLGVFKTQKGQFGAGNELFVDGVNARDVSIPRFDLSGGH